LLCYAHMRVAKIIAVCAVFAWSAYLLAQKIDLTTADVGRHIKNGELMVTGDTETRRAILSENFYSYTAPDAPFLNHHWGTGVVFYLVHRVAGFTGLHLFFLLLFLLALFFVFDTARRVAGVWVACALLLFLFPLIAVRSEVRPEVFSYLFSTFFVWMLYRHVRGELSYRWLYVLPIVSLLWVNLHIGFVFGISITGIFLAFYRTKPLVWAFAGVSLVALANPAGLAGVLYPLQIFKEYGYRVLENQSVWFLENLGLRTGYDFLLFKIAAVLVIVSCLSGLFYSHLLKNLRMREGGAFGVLALVFGTLAALGVRHFPSFALVALPFLALVLSRALARAREWGIVFFVALAVFGVWRSVELQSRRGTPGVGLAPGVEAAGEFLRDYPLAGPIFNNYDIGGYLIYFLAPHIKVFTDNRPEAYPPRFFDDMYIPAQERAEAFDALDAQYQFGAIVFQYRDATPWAQTFLRRAVADKRFEQAFADGRVVILVRK